MRRIRLWWTFTRAIWRPALTVVLIALSLISELSGEYGPATYMLVLAVLLTVQS